MLSATSVSQHTDPLPIPGDEARRYYVSVVMNIAKKEESLRQWMHAQGSILLGFSGGVDSAYLACVAMDTLGAGSFLAVIGRSASYPEEQWRQARSVANQFDIPILEIDTDELSDPRYAANPTNRCYFCKSELWNKLTPIARERGLNVVIDGTNADDLHGHRPGAAAARELGVKSPLAELGFTKQEIRDLSRVRGIPTWTRPSSPCLSSRIPYGTAVTVDRLRAVERAERALRDLGISGDMRVRNYDDLARVELSIAELERWQKVEARHKLEEVVRGAGFARVDIDPRGYRSGSLNILQ